MEAETKQKKAGSSKTRGALKGVKVLEWSHFVAAPYCAKLFADNGAEVIKVEEPNVGTRRLFLNNALSNKPLKLPAEQRSPIDPRRCSGFPGVDRPW